MKPNVTYLGGLNPLITHQYERYLPTAFDESMSILQKLNKVIRELEKLGKISNNVVDQWNSVMEWILDSGLDDVIIRQLTEWYDNGMLAEIINDEILNKKATVVVGKSVPNVRLDSTVFWYEEVEAI